MRKPTARHISGRVGRYNPEFERPPLRWRAFRAARLVAAAALLAAGIAALFFVAVAVSAEGAMVAALALALGGAWWTTVRPPTR